MTKPLDISATEPRYKPNVKESLIDNHPDYPMKQRIKLFEQYVRELDEISPETIFRRHPFLNYIEECMAEASNYNLYTYEPKIPSLRWTDLYPDTGDGTQPVGFLLISSDPYIAGSANYYIQEAYVQPKYRGRGIMTKAVESLIYLAPNDAITLSVLKANKKAKSFWTNLFVQHSYSVQAVESSDVEFLDFCFTPTAGRNRFSKSKNALTSSEPMAPEASAKPKKPKQEGAKLFAERLNKARRVMKMTWPELAKASDVSLYTLRRYSSSDSATPDMVNVKKLANCLGVNPMWLIGLDAEGHENPYLYLLETRPDILSLVDNAKNMAADEVWAAALMIGDLVDGNYGA